MYRKFKHGGWNIIVFQLLFQRFDFFCNQGIILLNGCYCIAKIQIDLLGSNHAYECSLTYYIATTIIT